MLSSNKKSAVQLQDIDIDTDEILTAAKQFEIEATERKNRINNLLNTETHQRKLAQQDPRSIQNLIKKDEKKCSCRCCMNGCKNCLYNIKNCCVDCFKCCKICFGSKCICLFFIFCFLVFVALYVLTKLGYIDSSSLRNKLNF